MQAHYRDSGVKEKERILVPADRAVATQLKWSDVQSEFQRVDAAKVDDMWSYLGG